MADQPARPNEGLLAFIDNVKSWVGGGIGFIAALVGFAQLVRSNTRLTVLVMLVCVVVGLWVCTIYIVVKREPLETKGKRRSRAKRQSAAPALTAATPGAAPTVTAAPPTTASQVTAPPRRHVYSDRTRHLALTGSSVVSLLTVAGLVGWSQFHAHGGGGVHRPNTPVVLVAAFVNFADSSAHPGDSDAVTQFIFDHLSQATAKDAPDVQVVKLGQSLDSSTEARAEGGQRGATIVLWGWYAKSSQRVTVKATFDLLIPLPYLKLQQSTESVDTSIEGLQNFHVQNQLGISMSYLTLLTLGLARYEARAYKSAIALLSDAGAQTPPAGMIGADSLYFYRGNARFFLGDYRAALTDFDAAVAAGSRHAATYYNRGVVRRMLGDWKGALDDYNAAIRLDGTDVYALYNRGLLQAWLGRVIAAISDYSQAIRYAPHFANAYLGRGNARLRQGDKSGAVADYSQVIALDPRSAGAYGSRASAYSMLGDWSHALVDYTHAIGLEPKRAAFYYGRGNVYLARRDVKDAIADYTRAIRITPREAYLYYSRGYAYEALKDWAHAAADYGNVIHLTPHGPFAAYAYLNRADVRAAKGDTAGARADRQKARELRMNRPAR